MNQLIVVLITALVTGAISISSLWLGSRLTRTNEDRKWRRDHALEAYSEFGHLVNAISLKAKDAYMAECESEQYSKHGKTIVEKISELYRSNNRIILLSSNEVREPFTALSLYVPTLAATSTQCPKASEAEIQAVRKKFDELYASFIVTARDDLGVHLPHQEWPRWQFWR
jgi:hypothetical protein